MVTEMVVKEALSQQMISSGADLTRQLDEAGVAVTAALWFYDTDANDWRFIIATPDVQLRGVRETYKEVHGIATALPADRSIALKDITVVDPEDSTIQYCGSP